MGSGKVRKEIGKGGGIAQTVCGIFGYFGANLPSEERVRAARTQLVHRGPDASGLHRENRAVLGHTLLSLIGDEPVEQPLASQDNSIVMTFNGEIYNYLELGNESDGLEALLTRRSDSETLVNGLALHGIDFVSRLNGMFAIAYADRRRDEAYLIRDRLGVKPLYYIEKDDGVYFASESKALLSLAGIQGTPDPGGWLSYCQFRYPIGERHYYREIKSVQPGQYLRWANGHLSCHQYWAVPSGDVIERPDDDVDQAVEELLNDAVMLQTRSDHGFCSYLSGGLDSSYLSAVAMKHTRSLHTYSVGLQDAGYDESSFAQDVAQHIGSHHHRLDLDREAFQRHHQNLIDHLQTPVAVPNQVALSALSQELSRDHRCVLSGEGADEIFGGYGRIFTLPRDWSAVRENPSDSRLVQEFQRHYHVAPSVTLQQLFLSQYRYVSQEFALQRLGRYFEQPRLEQAAEELDEEISALFQPSSGDLHQDVMAVFQGVHLPGLLGRLDSATMAHSVEGRVPFIDHRLVEFMNTVPYRQKVPLRKPDGTQNEHVFASEFSDALDEPKAILKRVAKAVLPTTIVDRRKMGFPIPEDMYKRGSDSAGAGYANWIATNLSRCEEVGLL